jgi:hypothetical protein
VAPDLALDVALGRLADSMSGAAVLAELGGTRAAAALLGPNPRTGKDYSLRTVERYFTQASQRRGGSGPAAARAAYLRRVATERRVRREGVRVTGAQGWLRVSNDVRFRRIHYAVDISGERLRVVLNEVAQARFNGDEQEAHAAGLLFAEAAPPERADVPGLSFLEGYDVAHGYWDYEDHDGLAGYDLSFV